MWRKAMGGIDSIDGRQVVKVVCNADNRTASGSIYICADGSMYEKLPYIGCVPVSSGQRIGIMKDGKIVGCV
jgi:hypothetical protein